MARRAVLLLLAIAVGVLLAGTARAYTNAGPISEEIQNLFWAITLFAVIVAAVVFGILAVFLVRYRESVSPRPTEWIEGNRNLEILWTVIPTIILIVIVIISVPVLVYTDTIPPPDTTVRVVGSQFIWTFYYEDGTTSSPDLWIQAGIVVKLEVTALDVIHSFAVPDLGIKIDAFPGHMNHWWMQADVPGDYLIQCAELCGVGHYGMRGVVHVFPAGSQPKIYGPPPRPLPVTDVQLRESGGNATNPWSIAPRNLTFSIGSRVNLRVWNNNSNPYDFRIDAPPTTISPTNQTPPISNYSYTWLNFTINGASPGPIPYGPADVAARNNGMIGYLTIQSGTIIEVFLDDSGGGPGHSWSVRPDPLVIPKGENVTFWIHNVGSQPHNFTLQGAYRNVKYDPPIAPGNSAFAGPFFFPQDASDTYQCSIPGHAASGMVAPYIAGAGGGARQGGLPVFDMAWITLAVCLPVMFAYLIHHARRREDERPS